MPRSAIIWTRSRELSLNVRYHRTHRTIISWSKCRPLKSSCAEAGSVIQAVTAGSRAFQVCTRTLLSGIVLLSSFFVPAGFPASGWTSYAPLSSHAQYNGTQAGQSLWCVGLFINGLASIGGAANYITTIINMRAPGMKMFRLPLPVWALFITAILVLLAVPVLSAAAAMLFCDLNFGTSFFSAS